MSAAWYSRPSPVNDPVARLVCFPHAGRGGSMYRSWATLLPAEIDLCTVNLPGRESRFDEEPVRSMADLASGLKDGLAPLFGDVPVVLFGHSVGALVALELTRRLMPGGPAHLVVSGCAPPHLPQPRAPMTGLGDDEFIQKLRELGGTAPELLAHAAAMKALLPVLRADYRLAEEYQTRVTLAPPAPIQVPITVLSSRTDPETRDADLSRWADLTDAGCTERSFTGGHFYVEDARALVVAAVTAVMVSELR